LTLLGFQGKTLHSAQCANSKCNKTPLVYVYTGLSIQSYSKSSQQQMQFLS